MSCPNSDCGLFGRRGQRNILLHSWQPLRRGRRRRYLCTTCGKTFSRTQGTPYFRLQHGRRRFDEVVELRMEGASIAAIARIKRLSWNTVARWLAKAAVRATRFNDQRIRGFELVELQADEICTFARGKDHQVWIYTTIEVSSRLWPATRVGRRSRKSTLAVIRELARRGLPGATPLIATDGYRYYKGVIRKVFDGEAVYGQVIKTRREDRVVKVERIPVNCTRRELDARLAWSEDSIALNTSFIERLNLTVRQGLAYLARRSPCHARSCPHLDAQLGLFQCFYNFCRPHSALRFGREMRTPAQQAGLASHRLTWREIFAEVDLGTDSSRLLIGPWRAPRLGPQDRMAA
ncbi:MAG: hypothetical protein EYC70_01230 [Planctomycetota bacterium]|nr:MAG: hypothetical protein EYC70_01230 [Planctomycetota bacterium]